MEDFVEIAFELGKITLKVLREVDASKREFAKIIRTLGGSDEEQIVLQKIGKYWNQENWFDRPDGLVVVTNYRLVFLTKLKTILTTTDYLSFPLGMIDDVKATIVMFVSPAICFRLQGQEYTFTFLANADEVVDAVHSSKQSLSLSGKNRQDH